MQLFRCAKLEIASQYLASNFAVGDILYDVILGMPWKKIQTFDQLRKCRSNCGLKSSISQGGKNSKVQVSNLSMEKFHSLLLKSQEKFYMYMVTNVEVAKSDAKSKLVKKSGRLEKLLEYYISVFQEKFLYGLPRNGTLTMLLKLKIEQSHHTDLYFNYRLLNLSQRKNALLV